MMRLSLLVAAGLVLSACASDPGPPRGPMGGPGPMAGPPPGLFVSPFGEVYTSEPGDPWPVAEWFARADADSDGRLTGAEFAADGQRVFRALDIRADGRITPDEIGVYEQALAVARARVPLSGDGPRQPGRRLEGFSGGLALNGEGQDDDGGAPRPPRVREPTGPLGYGPIAAAGYFNAPEPVKTADTDTNQVITTEEWAAATDRWFALLDTDHDGVLTLATLPETPLQALMERRR